VILLVNPYQAQLVNRRGKIYNRAWPPLSLANCAALLEKSGHQVQIIDANVLRLPPDKLESLAKGYERIFVCSSDLDRWQCPGIDLEPFLKSVEYLKKCTDEVYVLGPHGTIKPKEVLELTKAKAVIRGEPEITVSEICRSTPFDKIPGLAYRDKDGMVLTGMPHPVDLNELPTPAFHLLPMERYQYEVLGSRFTLLEGSRGCASRCRFCLLEMYGRGVRRKKVEKLAAEIEYVVSQFGVKTAYFMDLEFTVLRNQVLDLCEFLIRKRYGLRWTCQTRLDLVDAPLLEKMKQAGCSLIHFGVEAGTNDLLRKVNKQISIEQISEGMRLVHKSGIDSACFFILGFPGSNEEEWLETIRFAKRLNPTYALFHIATPYPGTALYDDLAQLDPGITQEALFPEACRQGEDLKRLKIAIRNAYLGFYLRPAYIGRRLSRRDLRSLGRQIRLMVGYLR
jgi:anaerobic magnesium-protoporphyrin IX monomethyl ester cyclase